MSSARKISRGGVSIEIDHRAGLVVLHCERHHVDHIVLLGHDTFARDVVEFFEAHDGCAVDAVEASVMATSA